MTWYKIRAYESREALESENFPWERVAQILGLKWESKPTEYWGAFGNDEKVWTLSSEDAMWLASVGVKLFVEPYPATMLTKLTDAGKKWGYSEDVEPEDLAKGYAVNITIPDMGLLLMTEVTWLENACTQVLQTMLDEGWRILAVCPPNAQRRPDYILGRRKG